MSQLRNIDDLNESQQKALLEILGLQKSAFRTSEIVQKMNGGEMSGRSVGAILGSLYRTGYLERVQGGRDKLWKLSEGAQQMRSKVLQQLGEVKQYWS
jgi:hypothetical protein